MGAMGTFSESGFAIDSVISGATFQLLGVRKADTITSINSKPVKDVASYNLLVGDIRTGESITVEYRRGGVEYLKKVKAIMRPYETSATAEIMYGWAPSGQCTLRTIVRKPKVKGKLPAVLLIPGYNCGSIENYNQGSYGELIRSWLNSGFVVVTIEKSGVGDSYNCQPSHGGRPCF